MTRSVLAFVSLALFVAIAPGQFRPPQLPYLDTVGPAANQLFYQVEQFKVQLRVMRPRPEPLGRLVDTYYEEVLAFTRLIPRNPPRGEVERAYRSLDRRADEVVAATRQAAALNPTLFQFAARIEHSDRMLEQAVASGGPPPPTQLRRVTQSLDAQANELLRIARDTLKNNPLGRQVDAQVQTFNIAVDGFRGLVDRNAPPAALQAAFAPIAANLAVIDQTLATFPGWWEATALRQQTSQVRGLVELAGQLVGSPINPPPPGPIVPPPGPIVPGPRRAAVVTGADAGGGPHVRIYPSQRGDDFHEMFAYHPDFRGGVRVAVGDVNGDGVPDIITAPGPGMPPLIRVFDGRDYRLIRQFLAFDAPYNLGVFVAAADVTGNGRADIVCGTDAGGPPMVRVFNGVTGQRLADIMAYEPTFLGGVRVAVGDVNGDGANDVITIPGPGRPVTVRVFDGRNVANVLSQFDAYGPDFTGGGFVATGRFRGRGADIVTGAGAGGGPHVRVLDGMRGTLIGELYAYDRNFLGGVRVACRDVTGDGVPDITTAPGPGSPAVIRVFDGRTRQFRYEFNAYADFIGGAFVAGR
jgi:hypothetical protein